MVSSKTPNKNIREFLSEKGVKLQLPDSETSFPIQEITSSACRVACPAGVNIKAYLGAISRGDFQKALDIVKETNPLPGICGRVCTHPCESECRRGEFDDALSICGLKRFIADYELTHGTKEIQPCERIRKEKVAIVGCGPAGLTAANDLIRSGYGVTIFEELPVRGGMLVTGIPSYRLPRDVIQAEIDDIVKLGVEIKTNSKIENVDPLFKDGYNAVFLAVGAHKGLKMNIPGEDDFEGVIDCINFLRKINRGEHDKPGNKVIVIGGGNSAIDSARSALRLGCSDVHIVYRRSRKEMPASEEEINEAIAEGVKIAYLAAPIKIIGKNGKVTGMECTKMELGEPDSSGRRRPVPVQGSEFIIDADIIVPAVSQKPDIDCFKSSAIEINKWDSFEVDDNSLMTSKPGVFAGGDAVTGPNTVIDAIAAGHRAAHAIDLYLQGLPFEDIGKPEFVQREFVPEMFTLEQEARLHAQKIPVEDRKVSFIEVELTLNEEQAMREAKRCLRCGPCVECIHCIKECGKRVVGISTERGRELFMVYGLPKDLRLNEEVHARLSVHGMGDADVKIEPVVSEVNEELCRGCSQCERVCDYNAIKVVEDEEGRRVAYVDLAICKGCGTCASVCPTGAAHLKFFKSKDIEAELEDFLG
ncbi:NAD(P)-binding protein [candidate division KSB1 bacterium]